MIKTIRAIRAILVLVAATSPAAAASPEQTFVEAPGPAGPLKGTMLSSGTASGPVVLIIPGSGPVDRDGNSLAGLKAATYRLLAEGLAAKGIATVRIDKRGMFASRAAVPDGNAVTMSDYATDIHSWTVAIRQKTGAQCVWLLGHSEGALVALVTVKDATDICGLVLVAAAGRPLGEVLREQLRSNPANAPLLDEALRAIDALEAGKRVDATNMSSCPSAALPAAGAGIPDKRVLLRSGELAGGHYEAGAHSSRGARYPGEQAGCSAAERSQPEREARSASRRQSHSQIRDIDRTRGEYCHLQ